MVPYRACRRISTPGNRARSQRLYRGKPARFRGAGPGNGTMEHVSQPDTSATSSGSSGSGDPDPAGMVIGILGGTGDQGRGLARRFALAGHRVILGSRQAERAAAAAEQLGTELGIEGAANAQAARQADIVIVAVPWDGHKELLAGLAAELDGKIVIDCVNPLDFDARGCRPLSAPEGSAAEQAAAVLPGSTVVGAFHHVSAVLLLDPEVSGFDLDVLVLGDDRQATDLVRALAARIPGMRGVYAGRLRNCGPVEGLTANLVSINRRYKSHAGIRITDI